jgi:hypothetical protein
MKPLDLNITNLVCALFDENRRNWQFVNSHIAFKPDWSIRLNDNFEFERNLTPSELKHFRNVVRNELFKLIISGGYKLIDESDTELIIM